MNKREKNYRAAQEASLRYVSDEMPGYSRRRRGRGFSFYDESGELIRDESERSRLKELAIPPAWEDVWICPDPSGHLQATGRDEAGRKQYIYHPRWRQLRDEKKFDRLIPFARQLPAIRRRYDADMRKRTMCRERVLAIAVRLLDRAYLRVGHETYARDEGGRGLTTLTAEHVDVNTTRVVVDFPGKRGKHRHVVIRDRRLARQIRACLDLADFALFNYVDDDGETHAIYADDVNDYLHDITGNDYTAKYFRTWGGTVAAAEALREWDAPDDEGDRERAYRDAVEAAADVLGNTVAVARKYYIHPAIEEACQSGKFWEIADDLEDDDADDDGYTGAERLVLRIIDSKADGRR